jgi:hypothetical protein
MMARYHAMRIGAVLSAVTDAVNQEPPLIERAPVDWNLALEIAICPISAKGRRARVKCLSVTEKLLCQFPAQEPGGLRLQRSLR